MKSFPEHVLQSPEWGVFREKTSVRVIHDVPNFQMTLHKLPKLPYHIGYVPKCPWPSKEILTKLSEIGKKHNCIFIKLEPNVKKSATGNPLLAPFNITPSSHPLFTRYTFHLNLTQSEEALMNQMKSKTRYNIKVAQKHGVVIKDETDNKKAFEYYLELSSETWQRQHFKGHTKAYHRLMWETLKPTGIAHLLVAYYNNPDTRQLKTDNPIPLTAWVLFLYKNVLYYPYGASSTQYKKVMASNLMMWEAIRWGKKHGATLFDMWGALGPEPDSNDPWYGFHRFKEGYGGELVEMEGSYDLILNPMLYRIYTLAHPIRQALLRW